MIPKGAISRSSALRVGKILLRILGLVLKKYQTPVLPVTSGCAGPTGCAPFDRSPLPVGQGRGMSRPNNWEDET